MSSATSILILIFLNSLSMNDSLPEKDLFPGTIGPWSVRTDTVYIPENLYDYINGGAELYISYGFSKVLSRIYEADGQPDIVVDIFEMGSSQDAYGVFMHSAEDVQEMVGQGTQYDDGFMLFWMDNYYVSIMAYPETDESREAIIKLARKIESGIGSEGDLPQIIDYLPAEELDPVSVRYFHHYAWQNTHYYFASKNILQIGHNTPAVLAKYGDPKHRSIVLVIEYSTDKLASNAAGEFTTQYLPEYSGKGPVQMEDRTFTGMHQEGKILIIVLNGDSDQAVNGLVFRIVKEINKIRD